MGRFKSCSSPNCLTAKLKIARCRAASHSLARPRAPHSPSGLRPTLPSVFTSRPMHMVQPTQQHRQHRERNNQAGPSPARAKPEQGGALRGGWPSLCSRTARATSRSLVWPNPVSRLQTSRSYRRGSYITEVGFALLEKSPRRSMSAANWEDRVGVRQAFAGRSLSE